MALTTTIKKHPETVSENEVSESSFKYFKGDALAAEVWKNKYALKNTSGKYFEKSPDDMHKRIAKEFARIEKNYPSPLSREEIYNLLKNFKYIIPQGSPMAGIGNKLQVSSLSNCFVIGVENNADSYGSVMSMDEELVQLMKRRGGVGLDLSTIRPKGSRVHNSALTATGIVPFMNRFSNSTREVAQGGRRGALMLTVSSRHPDAFDFTKAKRDTTSVTGANISLRVDDAFVQAVKNHGEYEQRFPIDSSTPLITKKIKAEDLWEEIIEGAWKSAEPGVIFWDTVQRESLPDRYNKEGFTTTSTNPCGEIPLCPYDSCRLMAMNLFSYVKKPFTKEASFDFELFEDHVKKALRLMDDLVDLELEKIDRILHKIDMDPEDNQYKLRERNLWEKIKNKTSKGRRTGLGITALGDMLAALGIQYGSDASIIIAEKVQKTLAVSAYSSSVSLAQQRGAFPIYNESKEKDHPFLARIEKEAPHIIKRMKEYGRRNIAMLTIAPTGSTSLLTQTTSGIEPVFRIYYTRRKKVNDSVETPGKQYFTDENGDKYEEFAIIHHKFRDWLTTKGFTKEEIAQLKPKDLDKLIENSPYKQSSSEHINYKAKVKLQGKLQKWVDHSISVTVNLPQDTSKEVISELYMDAWEAGCKGITVYREGSRSGILVSEPGKKITDFQETIAPKRPISLDARVIQFMNNDEKWVAVVGLLNNKPYEIFTGKADDSFSILSKVKQGKVLKAKGKNGKNRYDFQYLDSDGYKVTIEGLSRTFNKEYWNYAKLISGVLRHGMPLKYAVEMIDDLYLDGPTLNTWKNGVKRALLQFIPDGTVPTENVCPNCKSPAMSYQESCLLCNNCGYSKCG
ncbi:adenosylcobalamin-dependent ribonucleoside-diphosphate reductase [Marinigracilibium pacificum]|uniref:Vitamin B12-dependent ribonucleotide reductase n=1 Tax=Marinigracilibium pacificum TaxID=2729599 RepID=A0A848J3S5_9BACT|nr:adenosylcobalamin-dependent ribonucleoside-diphosphate reductase [Marinigracilibium pacificum]NMM49009.1 adenosylcobalamin-dependent ribonucleoside-diphosphate reductase [Marinigracilibium pacificum]